MPGLAQLESDWLVQRLPAQQPVAQVAASHTQEPARQAWPTAHEGPAPQPHTPVVRQPSATRGSHAMQLEPPRPQLSAPGALHALP
jgi:hypothetical protein